VRYVIVPPELDAYMRSVNGSPTPSPAMQDAWFDAGLTAPTPYPTPKPYPGAWMDETGFHLVLTKWHLWQLGWGVLDGVILGLVVVILLILVRNCNDRAN
jgi:hypothetical protein